MNCARLPLVEVRMKREVVQRRELRVKTEARGGECGRCGTKLWGWGPRWWVCGYCGKECRDGCHEPPEKDHLER